MNEKIVKIKQDLKKLRTLRRAIDSAKKAEERHKQIIAHIKRSRRGTEKSTKEIIKRLYGIIDKLGMAELVGELSQLENTYVPIIEALEPFDRAIFIDNAFNGLSYTAIAEKIGYSKRGVEERMKRIYNKIAL